jgi:cytochrome c
MVQRVQEMYRKSGLDATVKAIRAKEKAFFDRDLYAYIIDLNGVVVANGAVPAVQGKDISEFRDQNGKYLVKGEIEICKGPGHGWIDFRWLSPLTKNVEDKSAYLERLGQTYCTGVGIYRDEQVNSNTVAIISGSPSSRRYLSADGL